MSVGSRIDDLPDEVLTIILDYTSPHVLYYACREVCSKWRRVILEHIYRNGPALERRRRRYACLLDGYATSVQLRFMLSEALNSDNEILGLVSLPELDVNTMLYKGKLALLHIACNTGNQPEMLRHLARRPDIDLEMQDWSKRTPLAHACEKDRLEAANMMLMAGADPNGRRGSIYKTPLVLASRKGHIDIIRLLLSNGADLNACPPALKFAALDGKADIIRVLLEAGADPEAVDPEGRDATCVAKTCQCLRLIEEARDAKKTEKELAEFNQYKYGGK